MFNQKRTPPIDCGRLRFKLNSGRKIPLIGFGTYLIQGDEEIYEVLDSALDAGYRLIDTAKVYNNESSIGEALKVLLPKYNLKREDIFITSKLSPSDQGSAALEAVKDSIARLNCGYLDLYLIHWPGASKVSNDSELNVKARSESWAQLVKAVELGLVKDIGVANYTVKHLTHLLENNHGIKPAVNQVEWHPKYYQPELLELCRDEGIFLQAYASLGGTGNYDLIRDPVVSTVSLLLGRTPAQVLLRWAVQQNIGIIPKSRHDGRIRTNITLNFQIPEDKMRLLNRLKTETKYAWNPENIV